jgi:hypothetical protein
MRAAEILRGLADILSAIEDEKPAQAPVIVNVNGGNGSSAPAGPEATDNTGNFIPPLQQEIELMKRSAGVKSAYNQDHTDHANEG